MKKHYTITALLLSLFCCQYYCSFSQKTDCSFKEPVFKIDFGTDAANTVTNVGYLRNYELTDNSCFEDGYYSFTSATSNCFNGNWIVIPQDHTPGDIGGRMMLVNASYDASAFFMYKITRLKPSVTYEVAAWLINVCKGDWGCTPTPPVISFTVLAGSGIQLGKFRTGEIRPSSTPMWQRYYAQFTMPANETSIIIKMEDEISGGCGNDFAVDDITLRECRTEEQAKKTASVPKPTVKTLTITKKESKPAVPPLPVKQVSHTVSKTETQKENPPLKRTITNVSKSPETKAPVAVRTIKENSLPVPVLLRTRTNALVRTIETPATEMLIELYDNGEIDGDTVTVYHNNQLLVSNALLSTKPISFKIKIDPEHPHHELVMVANNLGSIPPNTSLMVITANEKRYEVYISSTEQKNAEVIFDLKE